MIQFFWNRPEKNDHSGLKKLCESCSNCGDWVCKYCASEEEWAHFYQPKIGGLR